MAGVQDELKSCLLGGGQEDYEEMRKAFLQSSEAGKISLWTEQLMVYFVYTYFCGSVYNGNPYGKMKAAVASTIMIQDMMMAHWKKEWYTYFKKRQLMWLTAIPERSSIPMKTKDCWKIY